MLARTSEGGRADDARRTVRGVTISGVRHPITKRPPARAAKGGPRPNRPRPVGTLNYRSGGSKRAEPGDEVIGAGSEALNVNRCSTKRTPEFLRVTLPPSDQRELR